MTGFEIVRMIDEYAKGGFPIWISNEGVSELSNLINWKEIDAGDTPKCTPILVCDEDGDCAVATFDGTEFEPYAVVPCYDGTTCTLNLGKIIAWMPLPKPPAGSP